MVEAAVICILVEVEGIDIVIGATLITSWYFPIKAVSVNKGRNDEGVQQNHLEDQEFVDQY